MLNELNDSITEAIIDTGDQLPNKFQSLFDNSPLEENLSIFSSQLESINNYLKKISEVNEARILYFKSEIALGNYQSNSDKIAMKMLNLELA